MHCKVPYLGNVRVTFSDIKMPKVPFNGSYEVDLFSKSEYFPYGMKINELSFDRKNLSFGSGARYGYNGTHEQDREMNADGNYLSFGNFGYDTRVAMRRNQEPLRAKYPHLSGYSAFGSNPIMYKDIDGNEPVNYFSTIFGETTKLKKTQWFSILGVYDNTTFNSAAVYSTTHLRADAYQSVYQRNAYYGWVQGQADAKGYNSKWFGAAQLVTGFRGVGGTEFPDNGYVSSVNVDKFLQGGNKYLFANNMKNAKDLLSDGKLSSNFIDANGKNQSFEGLTGMTLDYKMVEFEQSKVQEYINSYKGNDLKEIMNGVNELMNGVMPSPDVKDVIKNTFRDKFDFSKYGDRVKLGQELVRKAHNDN